MASAATNLCPALALGILAFAPLGPAYYHIGVYAGFASAIWGHVVAGLLGGAAHPGSGPRAAPTLILASLVAVLAADPALAPSATQGPGTIVAIAGATVLIAGALQIVLGAFGAGNSARFVPYPFVAGFMCGASALIILGQILPLVGITRTDAAQGFAVAREALKAGTLVVGVATAATIWVIAARTPRLPAALLGMIAGSALYYAIAFLSPGTWLGPVVGPVPGGLPLPTSLAPLFQVPWDLLRPHALIIGTTAGLMAFIGTVDGLFAAVAIDNATDGRHKTRQEVVAHGVANVVSGLCGGVPVALSRSVAMASWNAGGRSRLTTVFSALLLALVLTLGGRLLALGADDGRRRLHGHARLRADRQLDDGARRTPAPQGRAARKCAAMERRHRRGRRLYRDHFRLPARDRRRLPAVWPASLSRHETLARAQRRRWQRAAVAPRLGR